MPRRGYRKPDHTRRDERAQVSLTAAELDHIDQAADRAGLTRSAYMRSCALGKTPRAKPSRANSGLVRALNAIGNNLNQLAHKANAGEFPVEDDIRHVLARIVTTVRELA